VIATIAIRLRDSVAATDELAIDEDVVDDGQSEAKAKGRILGRAPSSLALRRAGAASTQLRPAPDRRRAPSRPG
jgi:hypothetical protein